MTYNVIIMNLMDTYVLKLFFVYLVTKSNFWRVIGKLRKKNEKSV